MQRFCRIKRKIIVKMLGEKNPFPSFFRRATAYLGRQIIQTDRTIPNNVPDIIIRDNENGTCMLIDVAISGDRNMIKKEVEKILK